MQKANHKAPFSLPNSVAVVRLEESTFVLFSGLAEKSILSPLLARTSKPVQAACIRETGACGPGIKESLKHALATPAYGHLSIIINHTTTPPPQLCLKVCVGSEPSPS
ncbi:hypothetical protein CDAR_565401 [Caerostris darwini]|uniref:Uncharacterized protein n=1 Tax=Caerostris darwini TaxID=1538125 RepID=A0AAV4TUD8_9ARAC|nr:hypothetical protein CDAR_565401 [Caerostris darwini]